MENEKKNHNLKITLKRKRERSLRIMYYNLYSFHNLYGNNAFKMLIDLI